MRRTPLIITAAILALGCAGAALAFDTGGRPWIDIFAGDYVTVHKICDDGRAVYVAEGYSYRAGHGIDVVENAAECQFGQ